MKHIVNPQKSLQDLNKQLRNPMAIYRIQDKLLQIRTTDFLSQCIVNGARKNPWLAIKTILKQLEEAPRAITAVVGQETIDLIKEFVNS